MTAAINKWKSLLPVISLLSALRCYKMTSAQEIAGLLCDVSQEVEDAVNELAVLGGEQNELEDCLSQAQAQENVLETIDLEVMIDKVERQRLECAKFIGDIMQESDALRKLLRERFNS